jgi:hypothetical protein
VLEAVGNKSDIIKFKSNHCISVFDDFPWEEKQISKYMDKDGQPKKFMSNPRLECGSNPIIDAELPQRLFRVTLGGSIRERHFNTSTSLTHLIPRLSSSEECLAWILSGIRSCNDLHQCMQQGQPSMPTRLLEVSADSILLRTGISTHERYVTLSHRWGQNVDNIPKLTRENLVQLSHEGLACTALSPTFRDMADLTYRMGIRFLWIDSLCIIQEDPDDFDRESGRMAEVFRSAYLCIFAAHGEDGHTGLYNARYKNADRFEHIHQIYIRGPDGTDITVDWQEQILVGHDRTFSDEAKFEFAARVSRESPGGKQRLFERGWVFQEGLLSPRGIIFGNRELVRFCKEDASCECGQTTKELFDLRSQFLNRDDQATYTISHDRGVLRGSCSRLKHWCTIVQNYSQHFLTFESDRLPAFSGVAKAFRSNSTGEHDMRHDKYLAGCWLSFFPEMLCWAIDENPNLPRNRKERTYHRRSVTGTGAPSWSWTSVDAAVRWNDDFYDKEIALVEVSNVDLELAGEDETGAVRKAHLHIDASHLEKVQLEYADELDKVNLPEDIYVASDGVSLISWQTTVAAMNVWKARLKLKSSKAAGHDNFMARDEFLFRADYPQAMDKLAGEGHIPSSETLYAMPVLWMPSGWPFSELSVILRRVNLGLRADVATSHDVYERIGVAYGQIIFDWSQERLSEKRHSLVLV